MATASIAFDPSIWFVVPAETGSAVVLETIRDDLLASNLVIGDLAVLEPAVQGLLGLPRDPDLVYRLAAPASAGGSFLLLDIRLVDGDVPTVDELQRQLPEVAPRLIDEVVLGEARLGIRWFEVALIEPPAPDMSRGPGSSTRVQLAQLRYLFSVPVGERQQTVDAVLSHFLTEVVMEGKESAEEALGSFSLEV